MNHTRRLLRLMPLALLGVALLVWARLPRSALPARAPALPTASPVRVIPPQPHTESDKWFWRQAESAISVDVVPDPVETAIQEEQREAKKHHGRLKSLIYPRLISHHTLVKDRNGIRALLHAFEGTPAFSPAEEDTTSGTEDVSLRIYLNHKNDQGCYQQSDSGCSLQLYKKAGRPLLWRSNHTQVPLNDASVARFYRAWSAAKIKARQRISGYSAFDGS